MFLRNENIRKFQYTSIQLLIIEEAFLFFFLCLAVAYFYFYLKKKKREKENS
jgi:preprotein translocase subunit SecG